MRALNLTFSLVLTVAVSSFAMSSLANAKPEQVSENPSASADIIAVRNSMTYLLEPSSRISVQTSERAAAKLEAVLAPLAQQLSNAFSLNRTSTAKQALIDILSLVPVTEGAFEAVIANDPAKALALTSTIRHYVQGAIHESTQNAETRLIAWQFVNENMSRFAGLANGTNGKRFLTTFSVWSVPLNSSVVTAADQQQKTRYESLYRQSFGVMKTAKPAAPVHEMWGPGNFHTLPAKVVTCEGLFVSAK